MSKFKVGDTLAYKSNKTATLRILGVGENLYFIHYGINNESTLGISYVDEYYEIKEEPRTIKGWVNVYEGVRKKSNLHFGTIYKTKQEALDQLSYDWNGPALDTIEISYTEKSL